MVCVLGAESPGRKGYLKNPLSQMKSLFCKEIDSHLRRLKRGPLRDRGSCPSVVVGLPRKRNRKRGYGKENRRKSKRLNPIRVFRKSPAKFDPSKIRKPREDDGLVGHQTTTTSSVAAAATATTTTTTTTTRKASEEGVPINRRAKTVQGDYFSHGRQYYHVRTNGSIRYREPESEEDYGWIPDLMKHQIDEFLDLNYGEKEFIKLWNEFVILDPVYGSEMLYSRLKDFVDAKGVLIASQGLYRNFLLHLTNLVDHEVLTQSRFLDLVIRQQTVMASVNEKLRISSPSKSNKPREILPVKQKDIFAPSNRIIKQPSSWVLEKRARIRELLKKRRKSLRRSRPNSSSSKVIVKYWGVGDYTSIKDLPLPTSRKRRYEKMNIIHGSYNGVETKPYKIPRHSYCEDIFVIKKEQV